MQYRFLGKSGVKVSAIGLGTNRFGSERVPQAEVTRILDAAADLGVNFLDSADIYQSGRSEETIGAALQGRRQRFVLASKYQGKTGDGPNDGGTSRYHLYQAVESSLRRLQTDAIDLYYVHNYEESTPPEELLRGLDDLVRAGKLRYIGASNFMAWQLARCNLLAEVHGWTQFVVMQGHYHLLERGQEAEMLPFCRSQGVGFIPYVPLAGGFLTGKYRRGQPAPPGSRGESSPYVQKYMTDAAYTFIEHLAQWAEGRGHTVGEAALAWLLAQPAVCSVISGATRLEQLQANVRAAEWALSPADLAEISQLGK
jgi:aryl-alcohol dehydrogenase-like predicted oxidoreductase